MGSQKPLPLQVRGEHGQELLVLQADEVLPEERAGSEELGKVAQHALLGEQLQPPALLRQGEKILHELLEPEERRQRVRRALQEAR